MRSISVFSALAALYFLVPFNVSALEVIVDNHEPECTVVGTWSTSTSACYGLDKYTTGPGDGSKTVTWTATLPAGWYLIQFRMNSNTGYTTEAKYAVTHRDGTTDLIVSQRRGSSTWYVLGGSFYFDGEATVTLSDDFDESTGSLLIADAIRFWSVFSFVQMSDSHLGHGPGNTCTAAVVSELKTLGNVPMGTYGFSAPPPSFAIHSGDISEYGQTFWSTVQSTFSGLPFPIYYAMGNHDSAQNSMHERIRALHGGRYYAFDHFDRGSRYRFVTLDSAVIQSPRAAFSREQLEFLAEDLASLPPETPTFLSFHHPIQNVSDPKPYDTYRLLETIRPFLVPIAFYGHGHNFSQTTFDGLRIVQGGATYHNTTTNYGYNIITVAHGRVYIGRKYRGDAAATNLLNMVLPTAPSYPEITVLSPTAEAIHTESALPISASIAASAPAIKEVHFEVNKDDNWRPLTGSGSGPYTGSLNLTGTTHGRQWIRVRFTTDAETPAYYYKAVSFWAWDALPKARWIVDLGASSLSTPAVVAGRVYFGTNEGTFRCLSFVTGDEHWQVTLPGDIVSAPAVSGNRVVFGCSDGKVYCLSTADGTTLWSKTCSGPVYAPPAIDGSNVYIGSIGTGASKSAYLYALDLATGTEKWKFAADNTIESRPCFTSDTVFFGAWDSYFYAVNKSNGTQRWRYQRNASRYYSPADSWPVVSESANRVFVADREYVLSAINIATGAAAWTRTGVSAQALTADADALLVRSTSGNLDCITFANTSVWSRSCSMDSAPVAPTAVGPRVATVSQNGLVTVVNAATGAVDYRFQVAQGYHLNAVTVDEYGDVFATTYDGYALAIANREIPAGIEDFVLFQ